jgi:hypothetical protein
MTQQTLVFNTTTRIVRVYEGAAQQSSVIYTFDNVPTVKPREEGYYEVIQKGYNEEGTESNYPVARFPVHSTTMLIEK